MVAAPGSSSGSAAVATAVVLSAVAAAPAAAGAAVKQDAGAVTFTNAAGAPPLSLLDRLPSQLIYLHICAAAITSNLTDPRTLLKHRIVERAAGIADSASSSYHAERRHTEEMAEFKAKTMQAAERNAQIMAQGLEQQRQKSVAAARALTKAAESKANQIKTEAEEMQRVSHNQIERLRMEVQNQIAHKFAKEFEARRAWEFEHGRALSAEAHIVELRERIGELTAAAAAAAFIAANPAGGTASLPQLDATPTTFSAETENIGREVFGDLNFDCDDDVYDELFEGNDMNFFNEAPPPAPAAAAVDDGGAPASSSSSGAAASASSPQVSRRWLHTEIKAVTAAYNVRGNLIQAILVAVGSTRLSIQVNRLLDDSLAMPPKFDMLVDMLRVGVDDAPYHSASL